MNAFVCDKCQAVHDYDNMNVVIYCDGCKQLLTGNKFECTVCEYGDYDGARYHKTCVTKIEGSWYCSTHKVKKQKAVEAATIIQKYAQEFWAEIGGKIIEYSKKRSDHSQREFKVVFDALTLEVDLTPLTKNGPIDEDDETESDEIIALSHEVHGIKNSGSSTFKAGIHSHQDALEAVTSALVRSLRSKKSALTVERQQIDSFHAELLADPPWMKKRHGTVKKAKTWMRNEISLFNKKRKKIVDMSKFLVAKLEEFKAPKVEKVVDPVLV